MKRIFLFEYQIRRTTFSYKIFDFNHFEKTLFSKTRYTFCLENIKIFIDHVDFYAKIYQFFYPPFENFTTKVTIP